MGVLGKAINYKLVLSKYSGYRHECTDMNAEGKKKLKQWIALVLQTCQLDKLIDEERQTIIREGKAFIKERHFDKGVMMITTFVCSEY